MVVYEANTWLSPLTPYIHAAQHTHSHTAVPFYTYHLADVLVEMPCLAELLVAHQTFVVLFLVVLVRGNTQQYTASTKQIRWMCVKQILGFRH
jgi:hypothetical protein